MNILTKFWNNFKPQPDIWFFFGFLLTFTLSVRKVLFFYPIAGQFNEWAGIYLYLSDIFLFLTIFFWIVVILGNKNVYLSRINLERGTFFLAILPLFLVILAFLSAFWAENRFLTVFKSAKLLEFYLLYLYLIFRLLPLIRQSFTGMATSPQNEPGGAEISQSPKIIGYKGYKQPVDILWIIVILGLIQAIIGILQFILQRSVGLFWLFESHIAPGIDGVAKIVIGGEKYIRAYGLFPHPNILGGFLLISIILTWACYKIFHPSRLGGIGITLILTAQVIALILTFSKSAILGLIIGFFYIFAKSGRFSHFTSNPLFPLKKEGRKKALKLFVLSLLILFLALNLAGLNFGENLKKSYFDRLDQWNVSPSLNCSTWNNLLAGKRETITSTLIGSGHGQYILDLHKKTGGNLENWQYQPIHNVFLLILAELGFAGVFIFIWFLWKLFHPSSILPLVKGGSEGGVFNIVPRGTPSGAGVEQNNTPSPLQGEGWSEAFKGILLGFIFIMLFDHYLWDIQQGQIMLWMVLGFIAGTTKK